MSTEDADADVDDMFDMFGGDSDKDDKTQTPKLKEYPKQSPQGSNDIQDLFSNLSKKRQHFIEAQKAKEKEEEEEEGEEEKTANREQKRRNILNQALEEALKENPFLRFNCGKGERQGARFLCIKLPCFGVVQV